MNIFRSKNKNEGFTLVEVLVVIGILGILFAIAIPIFFEAQKEAQKGTLHSDVSATAIETATRANSTFGTDTPITVEEFNSYKSESTGNIISLISYVKKNGKIEYCIEGIHTYSPTDIAYLSYNLTTKEYKDTTCTPSSQVE